MSLRAAFLACLAAGAIATAPLATSAQDAIGGGASFPNAVYHRWSEMAKTRLGIDVRYSSAGEAGAGQSRVLAREIDFAVSGLPMPLEMRTNGDLLQFPVVVGAVVTVFNLPGIASGQLRLDGQLLAAIYDNAIKKWNDPRIVAANPGLALPDLEIRPLSIRDNGAGSTYGFTQYILGANADWRARHGAVVTRRWTAGASVDSAPGMVEAVRVLPGAVGYMPYGLAAKTGMALAALRNPAGNYVAPSIPAIAAAVAHADWEHAPDLVMTLVNQPGAESFPVAQTSYAQVPLDPKDPARAEAVRKYFDFAYAHGGDVLAELGFVPLPRFVQDKVRLTWAKVAG